jgi:hypothetical protein
MRVASADESNEATTQEEMSSRAAKFERLRKVKLEGQLFGQEAGCFVSRLPSAE